MIPETDPDHEPFMQTMLFALCVAGLVMLFRLSVVFVKPGQRVLIWKRYGEHAGRVKILESGAHYTNVLTWARFGQGPFQGIVRSFPWFACPVPQSTVFIDPDKIEIMSSDNVPGTANVALELQVLDYSASDLVGQNVPFRNRACVTVNQWVSNQLGKLSASKLCSYAEVVSCLNERSALKLLNDELRDCFLEAKRISVDPSGICLHPEYTTTVGKEIYQRRAWDLQRLEAQVAQESTERKLKLQIMQTQGDCEQAKLKSDIDRMVEKAKAEALSNRVSALIAAGISPTHAANILVTEVAAAGMAKAEKVFIGMPQGLLGLRGIENVHSTPQDTFEKV